MIASVIVEVVDAIVEMVVASFIPISWMLCSGMAVLGGIAGFIVWGLPGAALGALGGFCLGWLIEEMTDRLVQRSWVVTVLYTVIWLGVIVSGAWLFLR